ncbi:MAG: hypothetical protein ABDI07_08810 [Candidatus Kryptonium sp.]
MIYFYDIENDIKYEPKLEFETTLKFDPKNFVSKDTFAVGITTDFIDIFTNDSIHRISKDFKFKIQKPAENYSKLKIFSSHKQYLNLLNLLLDLEPCFKISPPPDTEPEYLLKLISNSSCKQGFLEINSFADEPIFEEIIISNENTLKQIQLTSTEKINRILIYDLEKNKSCTLNNPKSPITQNLPPAQLHTKLFNMILNYMEQNISARFVYNLPINRDAIYRSNISQETFQATLETIKKAISLIKINQKEHREKIKTLIEAFYSEYYNELENRNLTTLIEKFYTEI